MDNNLTWVDEMIRILVFTGSAMIATFTLARAFGKHREFTVRLLLLALAGYTTATSVSQLTLWHERITVRTYMFGVCTLLGLIYTVLIDWTVRRDARANRIRISRRYDVDQS